HRLVALGFSERQAVAILYGLAAAGGFLSLATICLSPLRNCTLLLIWAGLWIAFGFYLWRRTSYIVKGGEISTSVKTKKSVSRFLAAFRQTYQGNPDFNRF